MLVAAACPPAPCPAHTAAEVCRGGTQSGSSPEKLSQSKINSSLYETTRPFYLDFHPPLAPKGKTHILESGGEKKEV